MKHNTPKSSKNKRRVNIKALAELLITLTTLIVYCVDKTFQYIFMCNAASSGSKRSA